MASDLSPADLPFLETLAHSPRSADRLLWLRVATDYFLTPQAEAHGRRPEFVAELCDGLKDADEATRCAVARKLGACAEAADILAALESLGGEAGLYVLRCATALPRERLIAAAEGDNARARAVARRDDLDPELIRILAGHDEIEVLLALARNRRAPLDARAFAALARQARQRIESALDRRLATALLERGPAGLEQAMLFLEADSSRRVAIMTAAQRAALGGWRAPTRLRKAAEAVGRLERFALGAASDVTVRILTSRDLQDGGDYRRVGALARLKDALNPAAADLVLAAIIGDSARPLPRREPVLDPEAAETASRPLRNWIKETDATPAALRRRRAFAFASGRRLDESA